MTTHLPRGPTSGPRASCAPRLRYFLTTTYNLRPAASQLEQFQREVNPRPGLDTFIQTFPISKAPPTRGAFVVWDISNQTKHFNMTTNPWELKAPFISITYRLFVQRKIDACTTVEDLKKVVFSTQKVDEAIYKAFNEKLQEITNKASS